MGLSLALAGSTDRALAILRPLAANRAPTARSGKTSRSPDAGRRRKPRRQDTVARNVAGQGHRRAGRLCRIEDAGKMKRRGYRSAPSHSSSPSSARYSFRCWHAGDGRRLADRDRSGIRCRRSAASRFGSTGTTSPAGMTPCPPDRNTPYCRLVLQNSGGLLQASRLVIAEASYASFAAPWRRRRHPGRATEPGRAYSFTYTQPYLTPIAMAITGAQRWFTT